MEIKGGAPYLFGSDDKVHVSENGSFPGLPFNSTTNYNANPFLQQLVNSGKKGK